MISTLDGSFAKNIAPPPRKVSQLLFICLVFMGREQPQFENVSQEFRGAWFRKDPGEEPLLQKEELQITENSYKSAKYEYEKEGDGESHVKKNETMYSASWFKGQLILERNNKRIVLYIMIRL
jgi:hypothetical protein